VIGGQQATVHTFFSLNISDKNFEIAILFKITQGQITMPPGLISPPLLAHRGSARRYAV